jgi:hypothetical protein
MQKNILYQIIKKKPDVDSTMYINGNSRIKSDIVIPQMSLYPNKMIMYALIGFICLIVLGKLIKNSSVFEYGNRMVSGFARWIISLFGKI